MADIFVSYTRADYEMVRRIVALLEGQGWSVWWDTRISGGERWDAVIEREITEALCVVVVWTPQSINREWVHLEAHHGKGRNILVPILLGVEKPPFAFSLIQGCNFSGWDGAINTAVSDQFLADVSGKLGKTNSQPHDDSRSDVEEEASSPTNGDPLPGDGPPIKPPKKGPRKLLEVVWKGERLPGKTATDVYVEALRKIGLELVAKEPLTLSGAPLASRELKSRAFRQCDGWYVATHSDTSEKYSVLLRLKQRKKLNEVEVRLIEQEELWS